MQVGRGGNNASVPGQNVSECERWSVTPTSPMAGVMLQQTGFMPTNSTRARAHTHTHTHTHTHATTHKAMHMSGKTSTNRIHTTASKGFRVNAFTQTYTPSSSFLNSNSRSFSLFRFISVVQTSCRQQTFEGPLCLKPKPKP